MLRLAHVRYIEKAGAREYEMKKISIEYNYFNGRYGEKIIRLSEEYRSNIENANIIARASGSEYETADYNLGRRLNEICGRSRTAPETAHQS